MTQKRSWDDDLLNEASESNEHAVAQDNHDLLYFQNDL